MDGTIAFDHKVSFAAIEVRNVIAELMLPPEFESKDLSIPKQFPQQLFGRRLVLSELASEVFLSRNLKATAIVSALPHRDQIIAPSASKNVCIEFLPSPFGRAGDEGLRCGEHQVVFLPSPLGRRAGDEGLGCRGHQVVFHPSPLGRRAGDEGLASGIYFVICAASAASAIQRQKESVGVATP
jgi:hypothetical protein